MISTIQALHVGNALRLFIEPPLGAVQWKILRKGSASFSGHDDPSALVAYQGDEDVIVDTTGLRNDVMQFYRPFYTEDGATWTAGDVANGTPSATYEDHTTDVLTDLRERLEAGLKVECERGTFQTELGYIQVYSAPPTMEQSLRFPLVTLHLAGEEPEERAIGEDVSGDEFDAIGFDWRESEGWLANVRLDVIGWSLNSDERIELRKAIRRLVVANLPVFEGFGWVRIGLQMQDVDLVNGEYPSHLFQSVGTFSCIAPVRVSGRVDPITDVVVSRIN